MGDVWREVEPSSDTRIEFSDSSQLQANWAREVEVRHPNAAPGLSAPSMYNCASVCKFIPVTVCLNVCSFVRSFVCYYILACLLCLVSSYSAGSYRCCTHRDGANHDANDADSCLPNQIAQNPRRSTTCTRFKVETLKWLQVYWTVSQHPCVQVFLTASIQLSSDSVIQAGAGIHL